jgi:hypothetical protein
LNASAIIAAAAMANFARRDFGPHRACYGWVVINAQIARMLGLTLPTSPLNRVVDEVID